MKGSFQNVEKKCKNIKQKVSYITCMMINNRDHTSPRKKSEKLEAIVKATTDKTYKAKKEPKRGRSKGLSFLGKTIK